MVSHGNALKRASVACLALVFAFPYVALANTGNDGNASKPDITLSTTEYIWQLSTAGRVMVDGRFALPYDRFESGSRIVVPDKASARAEIKGVGRVSVAPRSELVLDVVDDTLVARMLKGNLRVEVAARYGAYIETPDSIVVAHPGAYASFRVKADPLGTSFSREFGDVEIMAVANDDDDWDIDMHDMDDDLVVKARKKETLKIKLKKGDDRWSNQAVNFAITAALDGATGAFDEDGTQRVTVQTDSDGEAEVEFYAGASSGRVDVEASIPGSEAHEVIHLEIRAKEKTFWNKYTTSLYIALGAGAVAGAVLAIENHGQDEDAGGIGVRPPVVTVP